jgi:uncharacterized SAM-binding protein YcdF (DUF218 family)
VNDTLTYALAAIVLPPTSPALLVLTGLLLRRRHVRLGTAVVCVSALSLLMLSTPMVAQALARTLEPPPIDPATARAGAPRAVVILGGGRSRGALEWGGETVNHYTLQRLRYGARLARELSLPVLVSGGLPGRGVQTEAALMRDVLAEEFNTPVRWIEDRSLTTRDNARLSALLLLPADISRIVLVTDAAHMPRASRNFTDRGFIVIPAPTGYLGQVPFAWNHLVPSIEGLRRSNIALREWLAIATVY